MTRHTQRRSECRIPGQKICLSLMRIKIRQCADSNCWQFLFTMAAIYKQINVFNDRRTSLDSLWIYFYRPHANSKNWLLPQAETNPSTHITPSAVVFYKQSLLFALSRCVWITLSNEWDNWLRKISNPKLCGFFGRLCRHSKAHRNRSPLAAIANWPSAIPCSLYSQVEREFT